ncbi:hypothetical protein [Massilia glaciei]|uniref:hypothetical protein n=1 Tax=Massilia glaciei TaxID=1524097 RepID=UPI0015E816D8|nr:hypothetical protein [Massilia glaciei]
MDANVQTLLDHFESEGFRTELDSDGDIRFKCEGLGFVLCFDAKDPGFGKLVLANVWEIETPAELQLALAVLDNINRKVKVVKGHTQRDQVWFTVELWFDQQARWTEYLRRAIRGLGHALTMFAAQMQEANAASRAAVAKRAN